MPKFSMLSYGQAVDALRRASGMTEARTIEWCSVSPHGRPVEVSTGDRLVPDGGFDAVGACDLIVVCAGDDPTTNADVVTRSWLRRRARMGDMLCGIGDGAQVLAAVGLLSGYCVAVQPESAQMFREFYPEVLQENATVVLDRDRLTSTGSMAGSDAMVAWVRGKFSSGLGAAISPSLVSSDTSGHTASVSKNTIVDIVLARMADSIENPVSIQDLADEQETDARTLARRFVDQIGQSPTAAYMGLRLDRGRQLMATSDMSVSSVAKACGFASPIWFSQSYVKRFGLPPLRHRKILQVQTPRRT